MRDRGKFFFIFSIVMILIGILAIPVTSILGIISGEGTSITSMLGFVNIGFVFLIKRKLWYIFGNILNLLLIANTVVIYLLIYIFDISSI